MVDLHIHTNFSPDSFLGPEEACHIASARGLKIIGFADHAEFISEDDAYIVEHYDGNKIFKEIEKLRKLYEGNLEILFGVEVGYIPGMEKDIKEFMDSYPFDYTIGAVHYVDRTLVSKWTRECERAGESFMPYFQVVLGAARSGLFEILGHLDYVRKYMDAPQNYNHAEYAEIVDEILKACAESGVVVELNTSGWRHTTDEPYPGKAVFTSFKRMGGKVTVSSDAHKPIEIAYANRRAQKLLESVGFDKVEVFRQRAPYSVSM